MFLLDVLYVFCSEFIAFAEKKVKGSNLTLLDKKRLTLCKQELVGLFSFLKTSICNTSDSTLCLLLFLYDSELLLNAAFPTLSNPTHSFHTKYIQFVKKWICRFNLKKCLI